MSAPVPFVVIQPIHNGYVACHQAFRKAGLFGGLDYLLLGSFERAAKELTGGARQTIVTDVMPNDPTENAEFLAHLMAEDPGLKLWYFSNIIPANTRACDKALLGSVFDYRGPEPLILAMKEYIRQQPGNAEAIAERARQEALRQEVLKAEKEPAA